jgi:serine/threonine protein kinase
VPGDATIVSGRRVADRYRLVEQRSDYAWTAVDETLRRNVVVHVLPADAEPEAKEHFTAEARSLARLNHSNIVCTYDTGVDGDGTSYRVDELAVGPALDLNTVDDQRRVPYALQIIRAIADAHDAGLAHGSLGSSSVLIDDTGRVQLRGLRLPAGADSDDVKTRDITALVDLIIGLAPPGASPLRDVAVAWRRTPPSSARAMLDDVAAIPDEDDTLKTIPPHIPDKTVDVPDTRQRGRVLFIGVVAALIVAAVVVAVVVPAQTSNNNFAGQITQLRVTAKSFDPEAKPPTEFESAARLAVDGNATTAWKTEHYRTAAFGNLKKGVGLILQADGTNEIDSVTLTSPTRGWTVEIFVAEQPSATLVGWGPALASTKVQTASTTLTFNAAHGGAVLVWITNLGPSQQVRIAEAAVNGRAPK